MNLRCRPLRIFARNLSKAVWLTFNTSGEFCGIIQTVTLDLRTYFEEGSDDEDFEGKEVSDVSSFTKLTFSSYKPFILRKVPYERIVILSAHVSIVSNNRTDKQTINRADWIKWVNTRSAIFMSCHLILLRKALKPEMDLKTLPNIDSLISAKTVILWSTARFPCFHSNGEI